MPEEYFNFEPRTTEVPKGVFTVFPGLCKGCGLCIEKCPKKCLKWSETLGVYGTPAVEPVDGICIACGVCEGVCPDCAIRVIRKRGKDG
ncbi:MAG: 4Fe-4S dicluster domain-containing protein [Bacillota bacterium]